MSSLIKKRVVFLFGAGSVMDWGGPTSSELTDLVRTTGFTIVDSDTKITEFIYQELKEAGYSAKEINFETIITVIEELIIYFSEFNNRTQTPSILGPFLSFNFKKNILNFNIKGTVRKHGYKLQIPIAKDYIYSQNAYQNENPDQFFFQHLLSEIITVINGRISEYSWHTLGNSVIDFENGSSLLFRNWMAKLVNSNFLRLYTLNYDRVFKVLSEEEGIELFEGFENHQDLKSGLFTRANIPRILNDFDSNIYYNLHGSAFWNVLPDDAHMLPNPEVVFEEGIHLPLGDEISIVQIDKGNPFIISNIITGYQKSQKGYYPPIKQMQSAFDKDCCSAEKLYIVGYSFGDENINQSIKTALRYNSKLKIEIVDPLFIENKMDEKFAHKFFPYLQSRNFNPKKVSNNLYSYYNDKFLIYAMGFIEYLKMKQSTPTI